jgi:hypothetical protein
MVNYRHINSVLLLSLILGCSTGGSPSRTASQKETVPVSAKDSPAVGESHVASPGTDDAASKTSDCDDPKGYSVDEAREEDADYVKIRRGDTILHTIRLPTAIERNGFGFNGAKKTKEGFEISIEYGSVIYYGKTFIFMCRQHKFYLSTIRVESFDKHNPEKWSKKVIRVKPNLPLEKFSINDFMLEGVVQQ